MIASEFDAAGYLERGGRLVVFSDHGDRAGLSAANFGEKRFHHVVLATFGLPARCRTEPISLIDIGALIGLADMRAEPSVEFAIPPREVWPSLAKSARLRWSGDVELDARLLAQVFNGLQRHDPWTEVDTSQCEPVSVSRQGSRSSESYNADDTLGIRR